MNARKVVLLVLALACACAAAYASGYAQWYGHPGAQTGGAVYKFEISTGDKDQWDSAKQDVPPLTPGKARRLATEFVGKVPLRDDMKAWKSGDIELKLFAGGANEEWVYVVDFEAVPKAASWNGGVPDIQVPVRMDGTVPEPVLEKEK